MTSSSPKEHALLKPSIRSFNTPHLGTVIVNIDGNVIPSVLKTVKDMVRIVVEGNGRERYINGSNVTATLLQTGQTNADRYCPYNEKKYAIQFKISEVSIFIRKSWSTLM